MAISSAPQDLHIHCDSCRLQSIINSNRACNPTKEGVCPTPHSISSILPFPPLSDVPTTLTPVPPRLASPLLVFRSIRVLRPWSCSVSQTISAGELRAFLALTTCRLLATESHRLCTNHLTVTHAVLSRETIQSLTLPSSSQYWRRLAKARGLIVGSEQSHVYTGCSLAVVSIVCKRRRQR